MTLLRASSYKSTFSDFSGLSNQLLNQFSTSININIFIFLIMKSNNTIKDKQVTLVARTLKAIAHPTRVGILKLLVNNERMSVGDICKSLESEQSLTSHHLANMRDCGVLSHERDGKQIFYSLLMKEAGDLLVSIPLAVDKAFAGSEKAK